MTRSRTLGWARRALIAGIALSVVPVATADPAAPPPLDFPAAAPLVVDCATMKTTGVTVELRNDTGTKQVAKLAVSALTDAQGNVLPASEVCGGITSDPATLTLDPGTSGLVTLRASKSGVSGSTFTGSLAAAAPSGPAARLALSIAAAPTGTIAPVPLTAAVTKTLYRASPFHEKDSISITFKAKPKEILALKDGGVVGAIDGAGRTGVITYQKGSWRIVNGNAGIAHFTISGLDDATGTFTGKITLVPGDDTTAVTVTVTRKDWWLYPTLAVTIGILLALAAQRFGGALATDRRLRARLAETGPRYQEARRKLVAAAEGKPWGRFGLSDLKTEQKKVEGAIGSAARSSYLTISPATIKAVTKQIETLEHGIDQLNAIDDHARTLDLALTHASTDANGPLGPVGDLVEPVMITTERKLLVGEALTMRELGKRLTELDAAVKAIQTLDDLESTATTYYQHGDNTDPKFTGVLSAIWQDIWTAETVRDLERLRVAARLDDVAKRLQPTAFSLDEATLVTRLNVTGFPMGALLGVPHAAITYTQQGAAEELKWAWFDQAVVVATSFVVALTAALSSLYINKVFGSFWDYVDAAVWGLGTQATVATLAGAVDNFGGLTFPGASRRARRSQQTAT